MKEKKKSQLEKTAGDHMKEGHQVPPILCDRNEGMTLEEVLTRSGGLSYFLREQIRATKESYESALAGNGSERETLRIMLDDFLAPNIEYLRELKHLPGEFSKFDIEKDFALPELK